VQQKAPGHHSRGPWVLCRATGDRCCGINLQPTYADWIPRTSAHVLAGLQPLPRR
jgi:hypothetical protein